MKVWIFWCLSALVLVPSALSQLSENAPSPPYLKAVPSRAAWTITTRPLVPISGEAAQPVSPSDIVKATVEKNAEIRRVTLQTSSGQKFEFWARGAYLFSIDSKNQSATVVDMRGVDGEVAFYTEMQGDFEELRWLSPETFSERISEKGKKLLVFRSEKGAGSLNPGGPGTNRMFGVKAFIDDESRLPVRVETGSTVSQYEFIPPSGDLVLPESCRQEWERFQKYLLETTVDTPAR